MKIPLVLFLLAAMFFSHKAPSCTPPTRRVWIIVANTGTPSNRDTLWFGHDPWATACLDTQLCETEAPPIPPSGVFDVRFLSLHSGPCPNPGRGIGLKQDYCAYVSAAKIDTFLIKFDPGLGSPMIFSWAPSLVRAIYDSVRFQDSFGGFFINVNMGTSSSVSVHAPPHTNLRIFAYGQILTAVEPPSHAIPGEFALEQNYPNPFNPETRIGFTLGPDHLTGGQSQTRIQDLGFVSLKVFDLLGREVATLVEEKRPPGHYEVPFNSSGLATGVYFYRLRTAGFIETRRLVVLR